MHESHQVQHAIEHAKELANKKAVSSVSAVDLIIGEGLGFDEMSVRLHWEEFSQGTILENARLKITFTPVQLNCPSCSRLFPKKGSVLSCPHCGAQGLPTALGREFKVEMVS